MKGRGLAWLAVLPLAALLLFVAKGHIWWHFVLAMALANVVQRTQTLREFERTVEDLQLAIVEQPHDADHHLLAIVRPHGSE